MQNHGKKHRTAPYGAKPGFIILKRETAKEYLMKKNTFFVAGMLAIMLVFGTALTGCATFSSVGGTADAHGLFSSAKVVSNGSDVIASYGIILGLVDSGYEGYVAAVKKAESEGKLVTTVTTQYLGFYIKVSAYAK
jgi:predicted xylose isomerase-like sugar epimerase